MKKNQKIRYSVIIFMNDKEAKEEIRYVTSVEGKFAHWDSGKDAMLFDSVQFARDLAFELCLNGITSAVIEVPPYLGLSNPQSSEKDRFVLCPKSAL